ncbi:MAG: ABC transporter ATP-binding protein [Candidatus Bipolaricaulota bacterium]
MKNQGNPQNSISTGLGDQNRTMETILETQGLTKKFGGLTAVDQVDIGFRRGIITAIIGPNGAGKTTFFNLLSGLLEPTGGEIIYKGEVITNLSPEERSQKGIARSFQLTQIFPALTTLENVRVAAQSRGKSSTTYNLLTNAEKYGQFTNKARDLLKRVGLEEEFYTRAGNLTRANRRKLDVTIAFATDPEILLLDEPTAGMAMEEIPEVLSVIENLNREQEELAIVLIEHNMDIVMDISDTICVLADGKKLAEGTSNEIREDERVQQAYLGALR